MDIYAARETNKDPDINIEDIINASDNFEYISQTQVDKLLGFKNSVLLFMSPNDLTGFEQDYLNKIM